MIDADLGYLIDAHLSDRTRSVLLMRLGGDTHAAIAVALNISTRTVRYDIHRAVRTLAEAATDSQAGLVRFGVTVAHGAHVQWRSDATARNVVRLIEREQRRMQQRRENAGE